MRAPLRVGILGCGGIVRRVLPQLMESKEVVVAALAARDAGRARRFAAEYGLKAEASYESLLARPDIDIVYVALPESLHAPWSIAAAKAGKHVLCEKTLAPSLGEAKAMLAAARRHRVRLLEAFMWRFSKGSRILKAEAAKLGKARSLHARFGFVLGSPGNYRNFKKFGGGSLNDIGCYALSAARFLLGEPLRVGARLTGDRGPLADFHGAAWMEFKGGALSTIEFSFSAFTGQALILATDKGLLEAKSPFTIEKRSLSCQRGYAKPRLVPLAPENHYRLMFEGFAREIRKSPRRPGALEREALGQALAMQALRDSARLGRPVRVAR